MLTIAFVTQSLSSAAAGTARIAAAGIAAMTRLVRAVINRRDVIRLTELDDRALKDIGLTRSEVEGALAGSWLSDPSSVLAARSQARSGVARARREVSASVPPARRAGKPSAAPAAASPILTSTVACNA